MRRLYVTGVVALTAATATVGAAASVTGNRGTHRTDHISADTGWGNPACRPDTFGCKSTLDIPSSAGSSSSAGAGGQAAPSSPAGPTGAAGSTSRPGH